MIDIVLAYATLFATAVFAALAAYTDRKAQRAAERKAQRVAERKAHNRQLLARVNEIVMSDEYVQGRVDEIKAKINISLSEINEMLKAEWVSRDEYLKALHFLNNECEKLFKQMTRLVKGRTALEADVKSFIGQHNLGEMQEGLCEGMRARAAKRTRKFAKCPREVYEHTAFGNCDCVSGWPSTSL